MYMFKLDTYDWPSLLSSPDCPPACPGGQALVPPAVRCRRSKTSTPISSRCGCRRLTLGHRTPAVAAHRDRPHGSFTSNWTRRSRTSDPSLGDGGADLRDRQPRVPPRDRGRSRRALSQGGPRLRCRGAGRAEAAGSQLGADGELRVEPFIRQLLGAVGIRRERAHRTEHRR